MPPPLIQRVTNSSGRKISAHRPNTFNDILKLIQNGRIVVSTHGYNELAEDKLTVREIISGVANAVVIEDCPVYLTLPLYLTLV